MRYSFAPAGRLTGDRWKDDAARIAALKRELETSDAVLIGAGAGLSAAAGMDYSGARFHRYFFDFERKYGIRDMYSGGFYPFARKEEFWAWWSRQIYVNRYQKAPGNVYPALLALTEGKDYFVLTTNVDHQFQLSGFDRKRLFYTQGDYGLLQSVNPGIRKTWDNREMVLAMMRAQGFVPDETGTLVPPAEGTLKMEVPAELLPRCPEDGSEMTLNLRCDDSFVEDEGWHRAAARYDDFLRRHQNLHVLYLELGVGLNTPVIIKFVFHRLTRENPRAFYACVNQGEAYFPDDIASRSVAINADAGRVLSALIP